MTNDELAELERAEWDARHRALYEPTDWTRRRGREAELSTYRAELGDDEDA